MMLVAGLAVATLVATAIPGLAAKPTPEKIFSLEIWPNNLPAGCSTTTGTDCGGVTWTSSDLKSGPVGSGVDAILTAKLYNRTPGNSNFSSFDVTVPTDFQVVTAVKTATQTNGNSGYTISYASSASGPFTSSPTASTRIVRVTGLDPTNTNQFAAVDITVHASPFCTPNVKDSAKWNAVAYAGNISSTTFRRLGEGSDPPVAQYQTSHFLTTTINASVCNSAPVATVSLNDTAPETGDTITATATRSDPDNDAVSLHYVWKNDTTIVQDVTKSAGTAEDLTDSLDLSVAGNGDNGDTITVEVTPNDGTADGNTVSANATVGDSDAAAVDDSTTVEKNSSGNVIDVLGNDSDPDGPAIASSTPATNGTATCSTTSCTYTPTSGFVGDDSFTYTLEGNGSDTTATVSIFVRTNPLADPLGCNESSGSLTTELANVVIERLRNLGGATCEPKNYAVTETETTIGGNPATVLTFIQEEVAGQENAHYLMTVSWDPYAPHATNDTTNPATVGGRTFYIDYGNGGPFTEAELCPVVGYDVNGDPVAEMHPGSLTWCITGQSYTIDEDGNIVLVQHWDGIGDPRMR